MRIGNHAREFLLGILQKERPVRLPLVSTIYEPYLSHARNVLIPGPSHSMFRDPTLLYAAYIMGINESDRTSKIQVVDPIIQGDHVDPLAGPISIFNHSVGNWGNYASELDTLRANGIPLAEIEHLGPSSRVEDIRGLDGISLPTGSVHTILDHVTTASVAHTSSHDLPSEERKMFREGFYRQVFSGYSRILESDGTAIISAHDTTTADEMQTALHACGFKTSRVMVNDCVILPLTSVLEQKFADTILSRRIVRQRRGSESYMFLSTSGWNGKFVLIASKQ